MFHKDLEIQRGDVLRVNLYSPPDSLAYCLSEARSRLKASGPDTELAGRPAGVHLEGAEARLSQPAVLVGLFPEHTILRGTGWGQKEVQGSRAHPPVTWVSKDL